MIKITNEQFTKLVAQATTIEYGVDNGFDRTTFDKEKFAELIVSRCVNAFGKTRTEPSLHKYCLHRIGIRYVD